MAWLRQLFPLLYPQSLPLPWLLISLWKCSRLFLDKNLSLKFILSHIFFSSPLYFSIFKLPKIIFFFFQLIHLTNVYWVTTSPGTKLRPQDTVINKIRLMTSRRPVFTWDIRMQTDEVQRYEIFQKEERIKYCKNTQKWLMWKVREGAIEEVTSEMGLKRLGFCQVQKFGGFISHSLLSHSNLAVASTSYSWYLRSHFLTAKSKVFSHLTASINLFLQETFSSLGFQNTVLSSFSVFFTDFPFLIHSLMVAIHQIYVLCFFSFRPLPEDLVLFHNPIIFIEMILKSKSLARTSFLKHRAIFSIFSQQIQLMVMEALLGWVIAAYTHIT